MSYQVLARKWRPAKFAELVGQEHVKSALINGLTNQRLHHAYLFTGTRGVGKTSIARIFAKSLNCETGVTAEPCGLCGTCIDVDAGRFVDLIEIDAASRTKVGDTREILDNVQYAPTRGRYKIYLIDEVHMLSRHSFNALLKTLEEPPEHVKFLLATTDPQKLPVTILSRCLQFNLQALDASQIEQQLVGILGAENISFEPAAVTLLAKYAHGSMRDGLSLTDQAIAQSGSNLTLNVVQDMLGTVDVAWSQNILTAILSGDGERVVDVFERLQKQRPDFVKVLDDMLTICHQVSMAQVLPSAAKLSLENEGFVTKVAERIPATQIQIYYQLLLQGKKDLPYAPDVVRGFEMICLRLLAFKPVAASEISASSEQDASLKKNFETLASELDEVAASLDEVETRSNTQAVTEVLPLTAEQTSPNARIEARLETATDLEDDASQTQTAQFAVTPHSAGIQQLAPETDTTTAFAEQLESDQADNQSNETLPDAVLATVTATAVDDQSAETSKRTDDAHTNAEQQPGTQKEADTADNSVGNPHQTEVANAAVTNEYDDYQWMTEQGDSDEEALLSQQAFYQDMAESQGYQASPIPPLDISGDESAASVHAVSTIELPPENPALLSDSELDNPVMAILANRGLSTDLSELPQRELVGNNQNNPDSPNPDAKEETNPEQSEQKLVASEPEPLPELKPIEHEEVKFAHEVDEWARLIEMSGLMGLGRQLARNGEVVIDGNNIELIVKKEFAHLVNEKSEAELVEVVSKLAPGSNFVINKSDFTQAAPADIQNNINMNRQERAEQSIAEDVFVQTLVNEFGGKVLPGTIAPVS